MKKKILQIQVFTYDTDSDLCEAITRACKSDGHSVTVAFLRGEMSARFPSVADNIKLFGFTSGSLSGFRRWISIWKIYRYCKKEKFDIIISHRFKPIHILITISRFLKASGVGVIHGEGDYDRKYRKRLIARKGNSIRSFVAVSDAVRNHLLELNCGFNEDNTIVIRNAIDFNRIQSTMLSKWNARKALGIPQNTFIFGTIGRLVPVKGHQYLLEAFSKLLDTELSAKLVIIGEGRERENLELLAKSLCIQENFFLVGWRDNPTVYLRAFDAFVFPSTSEGLPLGLLEGMAGGLPAIGSDIPSVSSVLKNHGILFETKSPESLYRSMRCVLEMNRTEREQLSKKSLLAIKNHYSIERFNNEYQKLVSQV